MERSEHTEMHKCSYPECEEEYAGHYWGAIGAARKGWYMSKTGEKFCPKHKPSWVDSWRAEEKRRLRVLLDRQEQHEDGTDVRGT